MRGISGRATAAASGDTRREEQIQYGSCSSQSHASGGAPSIGVADQPPADSQTGPSRYPGWAGCSSSSAALRPCRSRQLSPTGRGCSLGVCAAFAVIPAWVLWVGLSKFEDDEDDYEGPGAAPDGAEPMDPPPPPNRELPKDRPYLWRT